MLKNPESLFLDYIDGALDQEQREQLEARLKSDASLQKSFEGYRDLMAMEAKLAAKPHAPGPNFEAAVLEQIEAKDLGFFWRLFMELALNKKLITGSVATLATLVLVLKLAWQTPPQSFEPPQVISRIEPLEVKPVVPPNVAERDKAASADSAQSLELSRGDTSAQGAVDEELPLEGGQPVVPAQKPAGIVRQEPVKEKSMKAPQNFPFAMGKGLVKDFQIGEGGYADGGIAAPYDSLAGSYTASQEQYANVTENSRVSVADQSTSTFSIDVDTASYSNARRFILAGQLPPADSVRVEEFINYFDYNYPVQHDKPFTLSYEAAPSPLEPDRVFLKLGIKTKDAEQSEKPWNLVFLVDVSGSMADPNKLELVKSSLKLLVNKMRAQDRIAIVTYAGDAGLKLDSTLGSERSRIISAIESLNAGGSTNGSGGINLAYQVAEQHKIKDGAVNRVVLATDGDFNVGITSQDALVKLIEEKRQHGITLTTLGVGTGNLHDATMEQLADKGNGNYFYLDSFKEARKVLETELVGNMEVVAKDVKLQIEFNPKHVAQYRLVGYENRKLNKEDFDNDKIDAGEVGSGHTVTAIYELVLTDSELSKKLNSESRYQKAVEEKKSVPVDQFGSELGFLKIRYKDPESSESKLLSFPISRSDVKSDAKDTSDDFRFASAVAYFAEVLRGSKYVGSYKLAEIAALAEKSLGHDNFGYRKEFVELVRDAQAIK